MTDDQKERYSAALANLLNLVGAEMALDKTKAHPQFQRLAALAIAIDVKAMMTVLDRAGVISLADWEAAVVDVAEEEVERIRANVEELGMRRVIGPQA